MKTNRIGTHVFAGAVCVALLCGPAFAQDLTLAPHIAGPQPFHATLAAISTNKDDFAFTTTAPFNGSSGAIRALAMLTGHSTHGAYTGQGVFEAIYTNPVPACTQPGGSGGVEAVYKGFLVVMTFSATGDQLFLALSSGSDCFNPMTGVSTGQATFKVVGGTGRFEGATGTLVNPYRAAFLAASAVHGLFNAVSGTFDGFITLK